MTYRRWKKVEISMGLDPEIHRRLKDQAAADQVSVPEKIRQYVAAGLEDDARLPNMLEARDEDTDDPAAEEEQA
jgi:hypothetical protein